MTVAASDSSSPAHFPEAPSRANTKIRLQHLIDSCTVGATYLGAATMMVLLAIMAFVLLQGAWPAMQKFGFHFLLSREWDPKNANFGAFPSIFGTLVTALLSLVIAVPLSVGSAIFLVRICPRWLVTPVSFLIEVLAAIPSITYGLWGVAVLVPFMQSYILPPIVHTLGSLNWVSLGKDEWDNESFFPGSLFSSSGSGSGLLTASVVLAIMVIPIITAVTRDVLRVVPRHLEEGAYGLGATWWQATKVVLSFAKGGIFGAIILGLARAIGETMAVAMVIGNATDFQATLVGPGNTMTSLLANKFREVDAGIYADSLVYIALILLVLTLGINLGARYLINRTARALKNK